MINKSIIAQINLAVYFSVIAIVRVYLIVKYTQTALSKAIRTVIVNAIITRCLISLKYNSYLLYLIPKASLTFCLATPCAILPKPPKPSCVTAPITEVATSIPLEFLPLLRLQC